MYRAMFPQVPHEINSKPHSLTLRLERAPRPLDAIGMEPRNWAYKSAHSHSHIPTFIRVKLLHAMIDSHVVPPRRSQETVARPLVRHY